MTSSKLGRVPLSDAFLRKLSAQGVRIEFTDAIERGLRLRLGKDGTKVFILKCRDATSRLKTITLGRYPDLSLRQAREQAAQTRIALKDGADPNLKKRSRRSASRLSSDGVTLGQLVLDFENEFAGRKRSWTPSGPRTTRSVARRCIEAVFEPIIEKPAEKLTLTDFAKCLGSYKRKRPNAEVATANGQVSRSRAYLIGVLDWAANRKRFGKAGGGRPEAVEVVDLVDTFDPATRDERISGERDRVLLEDELRAILPLLKHPAPAALNLLVDPELDFRPVATRFILLTAARREEVVEMRRRDIDVGNRVWRKPRIKSTRGGQRGQSLPLSEAALKLLRDLPHFDAAKPGDLVFPNSRGGQLGNWPRFQTAINRASGTTGWHRHDLRRTAATLMQSLNVAVSTIDQILGHADPLRREQVSGAASAYLKLTRVIRNIKDPQAAALDELARVLNLIEQGALKEVD
jgi:integrase